ncbi:MAG: F0F1 ATP synthase subunit gamma [Candidatus Babeliales bacterium]
MSQLIQMRQRIKAIQTIKKITHAMRLISMSLHARLKLKQGPLSTYKNTVTSIFHDIKKQSPQWNNHILYPAQTTFPKTLLIIVGANKGLCGNFNSALFKLVQTHKTEFTNLHYIAIGKKAIDFARQIQLGTEVAVYPTCTMNTLSTLVHGINKEIFTTAHHYTSVVVASNMLKNFFIQKPRLTHLIPFNQDSAATTNELSEYVWEQDPSEILHALAGQCINATVQYLIFESLLAEQAARFLSMDNSTRNAKNLLDETKLLYNKVRQAKITKEITELSSSF